ncbi:MAG: protein kinase [Deltaproteobacteria bacterium]|nr:protein kinase [Deltaproteobacteria bacterium]
MISEGIPFGRYRLMCLLGEGGMAKVYRAVLSGPMGFEKDVALKRLDPRLTEDERMVRSLINEARLGGQLRHKNIVEIYEFNSVQNHYFMAMEFVDGWTLDALLERARRQRIELPPSVIVEILAGICRGLHFAHTLSSRDGQPMNLVHRDLKPGNVIVSRGGDVKVLDFGIAKADSNLYKTTAADVTKGTPVYMSPEQVTGEKLDARSDLFSLGSIMVELVTLDVPFKGDNLLAIMHAVLNANSESAVAEVAKRLPPLAPLVEKCMSQDREGRFESAGAIEKALREVKRGLPPGPTLSEWLEEEGESILPAPTANDTWGPDGPPAPLVVLGAGSSQGETGGIETLDTGDVQYLGGSTPGSPAPVASAGSAGAYAETLAVAGSSPPPPIGPMTADFFATEGEGAARPAPIDATRIQKTIKRKKSPLPILLVTAALLLALVAFLLIPSDDAPGPEVTSPTVDPGDSPVLRADLAGDGVVETDPTPPLPDPTPAPIPDSTPAPAPKPDPTPAPKPDPTPAPRPDPTPAPKPDPTPEPTPAPVAATGSGKLDANSKPWSNLYLDGAYIGQTPKIGLEVSAGSHKLEFHCGSCVPAEKKSVSFKVRDGETVKKIVRFGDP